MKVYNWMCFHYHYLRSHLLTETFPSGYTVVFFQQQADIRRTYSSRERLRQEKVHKAYTAGWRKK